MAEQLLSRGADPNLGDEQALVPLDWAVLGNHLEVVQLLLAKGAKVNHLDKLGMTPLLYAASIDFGNTAVVEKLLAAGADRTIKNETGRTALDLARDYKHTTIATILQGKTAPR
jgi:ankyrin repeat protein